MCKTITISFLILLFTSFCFTCGIYMGRKEVKADEPCFVIPPPEAATISIITLRPIP